MRNMIPKFRKRWWEQNEAAKAYVEHDIKKYKLFGRQTWMLKLPKDFTCFHFGKSMQIEERQHFVMVTALARPGTLEYCMLEVDRLILRRVK